MRLCRMRPDRGFSGCAGGDATKSPAGFCTATSAGRTGSTRGMKPRALGSLQ
jgi:hypothetical protein